MEFGNHTMKMRLKKSSWKMFNFKEKSSNDDSESHSDTLAAWPLSLTKSLSLNYKGLNLEIIQGIEPRFKAGKTMCIVINWSINLQHSITLYPPLLTTIEEAS